jgi:hypothetical protein
MSKVGDLNLFYQWHLADPVDADEIARNNAIAQAQGSRNPYVDFPDLADDAWGLTPPVTAAYCASKGNSVTDEWIQTVKIGSFTKTSSTNAGYTDYTSTTITLAAGSSNAITLTPGYSSSAYAEGWRIWIDFNNDKDFADAGEQVFDGATAATGAKSGTIAIPAGATGSTRLRVSMKYNGLPTSCETFPYGEVEDYTVTFGTVVPPPVTYCASKGNSVADEWINRVVLGSINNTSGANAGYKDYTALSTSLVKGSTYSITVYPAWSGSVYSEGYAVWIDFNNDGDFTDAGETVFTKAASTATSAVGSFTVPATTFSGNTRMRVSMKYNGIPTSCEAFSYGEVEDYTVAIGTGATSRILTEEIAEQPSETEIARSGVNIYPNPAKGNLTVSMAGDKENPAIVRIYNLQGKKMLESNLKADGETSLNLEGLPSGLYNLLIIENGNRSYKKLYVE